MAATKQFLLNYDSNILLPYTTLDCILGSVNSDTDTDTGTTGISVITDNLLNNIKEFLSYNTNTNNLVDKQINASKVISTSAKVLGTVEMNDEEFKGEVYTKLFSLDLDNNQKAGNYLGEDGAIHKIFANAYVNLDASSGSRREGWYDASVTICPTGNADPAIAAALSLNIDYDANYMFVNNKKLAASHAKHSHMSEISTNSYGTVYIIEKNDVEGQPITPIDETNPSRNQATYSDKLKTLGTGKPVQLNNGLFTTIDKQGEDTLDRITPVWIDETGLIKGISKSVGSNSKPIYIDNGKIIPISNSIGDSKTPMYMENGVLKELSITAGTHLITLTDGEFGENTNDYGNSYSPVYVADGKFNQLSVDISTHLINLKQGSFSNSNLGIGDSSTPTYILNGNFEKLNAHVGDNYLVTLSHGKFGQSSSTIGDDKNLPICLKDGKFTSFTHPVPHLPSPSIDALGSDIRPIYVDGSGVLQQSSANVGVPDTTEKIGSLICLSQGAFTIQNAVAGDKKTLIYLDAGKFQTSDVSIGSSSTPVYLENGTFHSCTLVPESITGGNKGEYLMVDPTSGKACWGEGNTTTRGTVTNNTDEVYYVVGVSNNNHNTTTNSFETLTAAKTNAGTGIYFRNYQLYQTSDENLKTFTGDIDINFDNLATIKKGIYHWKDDENKITDIGVTAQSLEALYPEIVDDNNGTKTVAYNRLGVIALAAIDKLHLRVKELENEIKELKAELNKK